MELPKMPNRKPATATLTDDQRAAIKQAVEAQGEAKVLGILRISRPTLSRLLAGMPVLQQTVDLVGFRLAELGGAA